MLLFFGKLDECASRRLVGARTAGIASLIGGPKTVSGVCCGWASPHVSLGSPPPAPWRRSVGDMPTQWPTQ